MLKKAASYGTTAFFAFYGRVPCALGGAVASLPPSIRITSAIGR
jgi:hypothetical protein